MTSPNYPVELHVYVSFEKKDEIKKAAGILGISLSQYMREAIVKETDIILGTDD